MTWTLGRGRADDGESVNFSIAAVASKQTERRAQLDADEPMLVGMSDF